MKQLVLKGYIRLISRQLEEELDIKERKKKTFPAT